MYPPNKCEPFKFDLLCHHHQTAVKINPSLAPCARRVEWPAHGNLLMKFTSRAIKKYARAHWRADFGFIFAFRVCVYTSVVGSDNRGANIYGRLQISGPVLCVTREWKSRADLHGTEGIEFHDGCFLFFYPASAPRLAGI
jgi:hypothetical protein